MSSRLSFPQRSTLSERAVKRNADIEAIGQNERLTRERVSRLEGLQQVDRGALDAFIGMGWRERLKWILRGR